MNANRHPDIPWPVASLSGGESRPKHRSLRLRGPGRVSAVAVCLLLSCGAAWAIDLRIDFESNPASADPAGNWNTIPTGAIHSLYPNLTDYQTGAASGVGLLFVQPAGPGGATLNGAWNAATGPAFPSWIDPLATRDYLFTRPSDYPHAKLQFSGLDPTRTYRVELLGSRADSSNRNSVYTVNGLGSDNLNSNPYNAYQDGFLDHAVMTWRAVAAPGGQIVLDNIPPSGQHGYLSAMRISDEQSILIDLGITTRLTTGHWNHVASNAGSGGTGGPGHMVLGAIDAAGAETSVKVNVLAPFFGYNTNGVGTDASGYPSDARSDSLATSAAFPKATVQLEGLIPGSAYDVILFGSRADTGQTRTAAYTVGGVTQNLVNTNNAANVVRFYDVVANAQGHIQIDTAIAQGDYSYLGVIEVIGRFASAPVGPSIFVDFGSSASGYTTGGFWNNLATSSTSGGTGLTGLAGMIDSTGRATAVNLIVTNDFGGSNNVGETSDDAGFPVAAQRDSLFVQSTNPAQIVLEGLHPHAGYNLTFFGSRRSSDAPGGSLVLDVAINGETRSLDARGNVENAIMFTNLLPEPDGTLTIDFSSAGIGYLGAMSLTMIVPEPTGAVLLFAAMLSALGFRRRPRPR